MSCIKFTLDVGSKDATKAFNGSVLKYLNSEDKSISTLVFDYIKSLRDTGLYELQDQSELEAVSSFFENRLKTIPAKKIADNIKENILSAYKTELVKYFSNPEETINEEVNPQKEMEIQSSEPITDTNTEKYVISYKVDDMYSGMAPLKEFMVVDFKGSILNASLVDFDRGKIVKNVQDLNENIANLKNELASRVKDYLVFRGLNSELAVDSEIYKDGKPDLMAKENLLQLADQTFKEVTTYELKQAYLNKSVDENSNMLVKAYNAYALLKGDNFDTTLKNVLGENLVIKGLYFGEETDVDSLKYSFENNSHYRKSWGSNELVDAVSQTSDISRLLIEQTPMLNYITGLPISNSYLTLKSFQGVLGKLTNEANYNELDKYALGTNLKEYAINFHSDPDTYLKLMLEEIVNNANVRNSSLFTISDLNILRSVYERFYSDKHNSLYSIVNNDYYANEVVTNYSLLSSISGVVDRTKSASYTQYLYNEETGDISSGRLKQYNDTGKRVRRVNNIEILTQSRSPLSRINLLNKYGVQSRSNLNGNVSFQTNYKGHPIRLIIENNKLTKEDGTSILDLISEPSMEDLRNYYERDIPVNFTPEEQLYINILEFIDDFAATGFLKGNIDLLEAFKSTYDVSPQAKKDVQLRYLTTHLAELANKIAFTNLVYKEYENQTASPKRPLFEVAEDFKFFGDHLNAFDSKLYFDKENNDLKTIRTGTYETIDHLTKAEQIVTGEVYKSVVKNIEGNGVANNRIANLASQTVHYINKFMRGPQSAVSSNLFVNNPDWLLGTSNKIDAMNRHRVKKSVSNFSVAELAYTSILYDFYGRMINKEKGQEHMSVVDTQPTVYSDKTSFVTWTVDVGQQVELNGETFRIDTATPVQLNNLIKETIGNYFKTTLDNVLEDYRAVYRYHLEEFVPKLGDADRTRITGIISQFGNAATEHLGIDDFRKLLAVTPLNEYRDMSYAAGVPNIENIHAIKNGAFAKPNEMLIYNATQVYAKDSVYKRQMLRDKKKFIKDLINNSVVFNPIYSDGTFNTILLEAMSKYMTPQEQSSWTDPLTGVLILAKDANGNILNKLNPVTSKYIRSNDNITLNPLLERYFLTDYLLSENLRLITTGSAIAHPNKSKYLNEEGEKVDPNSEEGLEMEQSSRENAQLKRNVIIPATLQYFLQNSIMGIPPKYRIAVIQDLKADVYNYKGLKGDVDAHDGSAWVNPIISILENYSLQDAYVGDDKKPIGHSYKNRYGSAVLLKFATFAMYNARMRASQTSNINQLTLFKKMAGADWRLYSDMPIDLTKGLFGQPLSLMEMTKNERIFYRDGNKHYELLGIERSGENYLIHKQEVTLDGTKVMGSEFSDTVSINSVFDIHQALGGVYSESLGKNGELQFSDASLYATANYVNNIGEFRGNVGDPLTQSNTYQPLKNNMIAYLVNKSAIKVGAENVNPASAWLTKKNPSIPLMTMEMDTEGLGIQMDADHTAEASQMTEFSQVISSLEANGYTHDIAKLAYKDLGRVALSSIADETNAVHFLIQTGNKSDVYEIIGKAIVDAYKKDPGKMKLAQSILKRIDAEFKKRNLDHIDDLYKIPFSDPSLFSTTISTISSYMNSNAIKRKYTGMGAVMVPGYNIIQFIRVNGENKSFDDIYNEAADLGLTVDQYLQRLQEIENSNLKTIDLIEPGDFVKIYTVDGKPVIENGKPAEYGLDDYKTYTSVKDTFNSPEFRFVHIISEARDLRPSRIYWKDNTGVQHNIFDMPALRTAHDNVTENTPSEIALTYQAQVQKTFEALSEGYMPLTSSLQTEYDADKVAFVSKYGMRDKELYFDELGNQLAELPITIQIPINSLVNEAAEMVVSKLYSDKFGITNNDSINRILNQGPQFFRDRYDKYHTPRIQGYDLTFTKGNGKHTYITFSKPKDIPLVDVEPEVIKETDFIYRTNEDGKRLYPISKYNTETQSWDPLVQIKRVANSTTYEEVLIVSDPEVIDRIYNSDSYDSVLFGENSNQDIIGNWLTFESNKENPDRDLAFIADLFEGRTSYADFWNSYRAELERRKDVNSNKKFVSFRKSLDYTAARIPAQTMQSFMKMKSVGFSSSEKNIVYVSHWQTWLQGSDYDIDKAYIMGNEFDANGFYIGWSPLFRFDSIEALNASETLPTPNGRRTMFAGGEGSLDITNYLLRINEASWNAASPDVIRAMSDLLVTLDESNEDIIRVAYDNTVISPNNAKFVLSLVNKHNLYRLRNRTAVSAYKNSVSSRITQIIQDLKNATSAYSNIDMKAPAKAAADSPSGKDAGTITLGSPSSKWVMQVQNMDGKAVIGIAAVGEKIFFANSYYFNEGIRSGDPDWMKTMRFNKVLRQVQTTLDENGRSIPEPALRTILANVNFDNLFEQKEIWKEIIQNTVDANQDFGRIAEQVKQKSIENQLGLQEDQSLVISALLSAATDNAKELILSKINAGTNLAGIYLHLIMLGFKFKDIARFMTSPTVQLINNLSKVDMFNDYSGTGRITDVIDLIANGPHISKYLTGSEQDELGRLAAETLNGGYARGEVPYITDAATHAEKLWNMFAEESNYIRQQKNSKNFDEEVFKEFVEIQKDADETTRLGRLYGINQGLRTDMAGKLAYLNNVESALTEREQSYMKYDPKSRKKYFDIDRIMVEKPYYSWDHIHTVRALAEMAGITDGKFNFRLFLMNPDYRMDTIRYYDLIKAQWNMFDMITRIPHFKALFDVFLVDDTMSMYSSNKYRLIQTIRRSIIDSENSRGRRLTEDQLKALENYVDDVLIVKWLSDNKISFTIPEGGSYIKPTGEIVVASSPETFVLSTPEGRATYKLWMEQSVVPDLKSGIVEGKKMSSLLINSFIQDLQMNRRKDFTGYQVDYIKLPLDLMDIKTETDEAALEKYKEGFQRLTKIKLQDRSLADHFFLYNLIVNRNRYGSDRFTPLFNSLLESGMENSLMLDYQRTVGESDYLLSQVDIPYSLDDALKAIAPIVSRNSSNTDPYVRIYNPLIRKYELYSREKNSKRYNLVYEFLDPTLGKNYNNYFVLNVSNASPRSFITPLDPDSPTARLANDFRKLISRNTLNITIDCK